MVGLFEFICSKCQCGQSIHGYLMHMLKHQQQVRYLSSNFIKMAGYGFLRFSIPMFPVASEYFTPLILFIKYNCNYLHFFSCTNARRHEDPIAYSSVAHMGYVTLGIFTLTKQGIEGSIYQMISHGLICCTIYMCWGSL